MWCNLFNFKRINQIVTIGCTIWCAYLLTLLWAPLWQKGLVHEDYLVVFPTPPSLVSLFLSLVDFPLGTWYLRPVRFWLFSISNFFFGPNPFVYSIWAVGLLMGGVFFLYRFFRSFFSASPLLLVFVLGIFCMSGVHPKSLFWTCSIHNQLCFFFASGALYFRHSNMRWQSALFFALAAFSRESAIAWALPLMTLDYLKHHNEKGAKWRALVDSSWELVAIPLVYLSLYFYAIPLDTPIQIANIEPKLGIIENFIILSASFFGLNAEQMPLKIEPLKTEYALAVLFFVYLIFLTLEMFFKRCKKSILVVSIVLGGIFIPFIHSGIIQIEYALLMGIGVTAGLIDILTRILNFLSSVLPKKQFNYLELSSLLILIMLAFPYFFQTNKKGYQNLFAEFVTDSALLKKVILDFTRISEKARPGEIFEIKIEKDLPGYFRHQVKIFLPFAHKEFIPGRFFVYSYSDPPYGLNRSDTNNPLTEKILSTGKIRSFSLSRKNWIKEI